MGRKIATILILLNIFMLFCVSKAKGQVKKDSPELWQFLSQTEGTVLDYGLLKVKTLQQVRFILNKGVTYKLYLKGLKGNVKISSSSLDLSIELEGGQSEIITLAVKQAKVVFITISPKRKGKVLYALTFKPN